MIFADSRQIMTHPTSYSEQWNGELVFLLVKCFQVSINQDYLASICVSTYLRTEFFFPLWKVFVSVFS